MIGNSLGERSFIRPRKRCKVNIKTAHKYAGCKCVRWISGLTIVYNGEICDMGVGSFQFYILRSTISGQNKKMLLQLPSHSSCLIIHHPAIRQCHRQTCNKSLERKNKDKQTMDLSDHLHVLTTKPSSRSLCGKYIISLFLSVVHTYSKKEVTNSSFSNARCEGHKWYAFHEHFRVYVNFIQNYNKTYRNDASVSFVSVARSILQTPISSK